MREIILCTEMTEDSQIHIAIKTTDHLKKGRLTQELHLTPGRETRILSRTEDFDLITNHVEKSRTRNI